ncbi:hypothetical protein GCM10023114_18980 [Mycolicibacterium sediminis]|uniref:Uncharacterized protein n=1 Tax=Mycolicibacterium sediminis TaxID=1286180 RepID=A0A7I7QQM5_9MYCO|nr:hypothetical protein MSEDJ_26710 [Mycolicibacterium sediminis]
MQHCGQIVRAIEEPAEFSREPGLVDSQEFEEHVLLGREVEVEGTSGHSCCLDDCVDVSRVGAGPLELHHCGVENARTGTKPLSLTPLGSVAHVIIVPLAWRTLTCVTEMSRLRVGISGVDFGE